MKRSRDVQVIMNFADRIRGKKLEPREEHVKPPTSSSSSNMPFSLPEFKRPDAFPIDREKYEEPPYMKKEPAIANLYRRKFSSQKDMAEKRVLEEGEQEEPFIGNKGEKFAEEYLRNVKYNASQLDKRLKQNFVKQPSVRNNIPKAIRARPVGEQLEYIGKKYEDGDIGKFDAKDMSRLYMGIEDVKDKTIQSAQDKKLQRIRELQASTRIRRKVKEVAERRTMEKENIGAGAEEHKQSGEPNRDTSSFEPDQIIKDAESLLDKLYASSEIKATPALLNEAKRLGITNANHILTKNLIAKVRSRLTSIKGRLEKERRQSVSPAKGYRTPKKGGGGRTPKSV